MEVVFAIPDQAGIIDTGYALNFVTTVTGHMELGPAQVRTMIVKSDRTQSTYLYIGMGRLTSKPALVLPLILISDSILIFYRSIIWGA